MSMSFSSSGMGSQKGAPSLVLYNPHSSNIQIISVGQLVFREYFFYHDPSRDDFPVKGIVPIKCNSS